MGEFRWRMGIIFQATHEIVMSGVDAVFPGRRIRAIEAMAQGQSNAAHIRLMKHIERDIGIRQTGATFEDMQFVGYAELE